MVSFSWQATGDRETGRLRIDVVVAAIEMVEWQDKDSVSSGSGCS